MGWWSDRSPARHGPQIWNVQGIRKLRALSTGGWRWRKFIPTQKAAGGRAVTECGAAGDEKTSGHGSAEAWLWRDGSCRLVGLPAPEPGLCWVVVGLGNGSAPPAPPDDRQTDRHSTRGTSPISHGCSLLILQYPSGNLFSWLLLLSVYCVPWGLAPGRCWLLAGAQLMPAGVVGSESMLSL